LTCNCLEISLYTQTNSINSRFLVDSRYASPLASLLQIVAAEQVTEKHGNVLWLQFVCWIPGDQMEIAACGADVLERRW